MTTTKNVQVFLRNDCALILGVDAPLLARERFPVNEQTANLCSTLSTDSGCFVFTASGRRMTRAERAWLVAFMQGWSAAGARELVVTDQTTPSPQARTAKEVAR